jgi:hypothetical protein
MRLQDLDEWVDGHQARVYPFVADTSAWRTGLTDMQIPSYGEFLAVLHGTQLPPDLSAQVVEETFDPPSLARMRRIAARTAALRDLVRMSAAQEMLRRTRITAAASRTAASATNRLVSTDWNNQYRSPGCSVHRL